MVGWGLGELMKDAKPEGACLVWALKASLEPGISHCLEMCNRTKLFPTQKGQPALPPGTHWHCCQSLSLIDYSAVCA